MHPEGGLHYPKNWPVELDGSIDIFLTIYMCGMNLMAIVAIV